MKVEKKNHLLGRCVIASLNLAFQYCPSNACCNSWLKRGSLVTAPEKKIEAISLKDKVSLIKLLFNWLNCVNAYAKVEKLYQLNQSCMMHHQVRHSTLPPTSYHTHTLLRKISKGKFSKSEGYNQKKEK